MSQNLPCSIGIDIGGTNLRVALVNQNGLIIDQIKQPTPNNSEALLHDLKLLCEKIIKSSNKEITGIGVGWPGPVDRKSGKIIQAPNIPGLEQFPLTSFLSKEFGVNCALDNDAKCAAIGEKHFGGARPFKNFVLLTFGTGIGGAVYINEQIYYGKTGGAGEIGHMTIIENGAPCPCGNKGCFERYASSIALEREAESKLGKKISSKQLVEAFENGESWAVGLMDEFTDHASTGIASVINIFDPEAVVLSGGLFSSPHMSLIRLIETKIRTRCFSSFQRDFHLVASSLQGSAGLVGAAVLTLPVASI